jgi:hypothetical protein
VGANDTVGIDEHEPIRQQLRSSARRRGHGRARALSPSCRGPSPVSA